MSNNDPAHLLEAAKETRQKGDYAKARSLAEVAMSSLMPADDDYVAAVLEIALNMRQQGELQSAIDMAERAISLANEGRYEQRIAESYEVQGTCYRNLGQYERGLECLQLAFDIYDKLQLQSKIGRITTYIGTIHMVMGESAKGLDFFIKALSINEELNDLFEMAGTLDGIAGIYGELGLSDLSIEYYDKALLISQDIQDKSLTARINGNMGITYFEMGSYDKALKHSQEALAISQEIGERRQVGFWLLSVGDVLNRIGDKSEALKYYLQALDIRQNELRTMEGVSLNLHQIAEILLYQQNYNEGIEKLEQALTIAIENKERIDQYTIHKTLSMAYAQINNHKAALESFQQFYELEKQVQGDELRKQIKQFEIERNMAEREKQHAIERAKHEVTEQLLHNVLPPTIAQQMIEGATTIAKKLDNVSILFADIVNFTALSQQITPDQLVEGLDIIFSEFDELAEKHGLEKIKTIGDAYMVVAGAPDPRSDHAVAIANMAIGMQSAVRKFRAISTHEEIQIRIGIHTGEVVAGVIGKKKFAYDLWGDAVNTAARMESHGEAGKIHVSGEFAQALLGMSSVECRVSNGELRMEDGENEGGARSDSSYFTFHSSPFTLQARGVLSIKGKGELRTYFLSGVNQ